MTTQQNNSDYQSSEWGDREAESFFAAMRLNAMARGVKWVDTYELSNKVN